MSPEELAAGMRWVSERFFPILKESDAGAAKDEQPSIDWVLDKARVAVLRWARRAGPRREAAAGAGQRLGGLTGQLRRALRHWAAAPAPGTRLLVAATALPQRRCLCPYRYGIRGLVIDPYNELSHQRPKGLSETEYVSQMLSKVRRAGAGAAMLRPGPARPGRSIGLAAWQPGSRSCCARAPARLRSAGAKPTAQPSPCRRQHLPQIKRFAQNYDCHVWFVAHPRVLRDWRGEPPNLYDISGSAHFINKADNGLVVHRVWPSKEQQGRGGARRAKGADGGGGEQQQQGQQAQQEAPENAVRLLVRKVRNKAVGRVGESVLLYDRATGRYSCAGPGATLAQLAGRGGGVQQQLGGGGRGGAGGGAAAAAAAAGAPREMSTGWGSGGGAVARAPSAPAPDVNWQGEVEGEEAAEEDEEGAGGLGRRDTAREMRALGLDPAAVAVEDLTRPRAPQVVDPDSPLTEYGA
jgi:hypothetical protein